MSFGEGGADGRTYALATALVEGRGPLARVRFFPRNPGGALAATRFYCAAEDAILARRPSFSLDRQVRPLPRLRPCGLPLGALHSPDNRRHIK